MTEVMGIVNGTTNFILTRMLADGMEFQEALDLASRLGYAEADPSADIEGLGCRQKGGDSGLGGVSLQGYAGRCLHGGNYKNYRHRYPLCRKWGIP